MINSIVKTTVLFIFGLTMDEYEYYLKEKKTEVKQILLFILLWVTIFLGVTVYYYALNRSEFVEVHQQCMGVSLSMQECANLWRTIPTLR